MYIYVCGYKAIYGFLGDIDFRFLGLGLGGLGFRVQSSGFGSMVLVFEFGTLWLRAQNPKP